MFGMEATEPCGTDESAVGIEYMVQRRAEYRYGGDACIGLWPVLIPQNKEFF